MVFVAELGYKSSAVQRQEELDLSDEASSHEEVFHCGWRLPLRSGQEGVQSTIEKLAQGKTENQKLLLLLARRNTTAEQRKNGETMHRPDNNA